MSPTSHFRWHEMAYKLAAVDPPVDRMPPPRSQHDICARRQRKHGGHRRSIQTWRRIPAVDNKGPELY